MNISLPPIIYDVMPVLQGLNAEQKLYVVKSLLSDNAERDFVNAKKTDENLAWETGKDWFGTYHSGRNDLSQNAKQLVKQKINPSSTHLKNQ